MKIHERIKAARERAEIPLRDLARRAGISSTHLVRLESGECLPSEEHLRALCEHVTLDFDSMMRQMGRVPAEVQGYITRTPGVLRQLRRRMSAA